MNSKFNINKEKTINSILFVLDSLGGKCDFHKIFKILYFADQRHLTLYGTPITDDSYIAMKYGPVPSNSYDIFKALRGDSLSISDSDYGDFFEIDSHDILISKKEADIEELAESHIECLESSIRENKDLDFIQLSQKSHKMAWDNARNDEMNVIDIAREGGANEEMIKYIYLNLENQITFKQYAHR